MHTCLGIFIHEARTPDIPSIQHQMRDKCSGYLFVKPENLFKNILNNNNNKPAHSSKRQTNAHLCSGYLFLKPETLKHPARSSKRETNAHLCQIYSLVKQEHLKQPAHPIQALADRVSRGEWHSLPLPLHSQSQRVCAKV